MSEVHVVVAVMEEVSSDQRYVRSDTRITVGHGRVHVLVLVEVSPDVGEKLICEGKGLRGHFLQVFALVYRGLCQGNFRLIFLQDEG